MTPVVRDPRRRTAGFIQRLQLLLAEAHLLLGAQDTDGSFTYHVDTLSMRVHLASNIFSVLAIDLREAAPWTAA
jgi:hypothetical protein